MQTHIEERERTSPLSKRIKEIFKKHGVTVTAIFSAAGITIRAVLGTLIDALKATGKALGNGVEELGQDTASMLPGLISQVVRFLFKTVGQVLWYLAERTWLLILAAVVFITEKYFKSSLRNGVTSKP